jgi:3-oxoacyl-[acyl-carrier protein] reductase
VTGAASGFGEATAKRFASEGARVVVADVDEAGGSRAVSEIVDAGGSAVFVATDVSQSSDVKRLVASTLEQFGRLDVIVNNAGVAHRAMPMAELPEADYDRVFATNVKSVYLSVVHGARAP